MYPPLFLNYCAANELRLTSLRKQVLFILWDAIKPLKAYEILDKLLLIQKNYTASTVYRVLDYFVEYGIVHKIESIQSYTLCDEPKRHRPSEILMVCAHCHSVCETFDEEMILRAQLLSQRNNFHLGDGVIELKGLCSSCRTQDLI